MKLILYFYLSITLICSVSLKDSTSSSSSSSSSESSDSTNSTNSTNSTDSTSSQCSTDTNSSDSTCSASTTLFEIFLPYRMDFFTEMKLTTIFPRNFMYTLKNYSQSKAEEYPILNLANTATGSIRLGVVQIADMDRLNELLKLFKDLTKRVFRTGLNEHTIGGNFRIKMKGLTIDPNTRFLMTNFEIDYPTDSHARYVTFLKSLFNRLMRLNQTYQSYSNIRLDSLVLGIVDDMAAIDLPAFDKTFSNFDLGFVTFDHVTVQPAGNKCENMRSIFYFDHLNHEPVIGIENSTESEEKEK